MRCETPTFRTSQNHSEIRLGSGGWDGHGDWGVSSVPFLKWSINVDQT